MRPLKKQKTQEYNDSTQNGEISILEKKGPWVLEEDQLLECLVYLFGPTNWTIAAQYIPGRNGKSCRLRWKNHLDPQVNQKPFSLIEDALIVRAVEQSGHKWSDISKMLRDRTDNSIKNRWYSTLKRYYENGELHERNALLKHKYTLQQLLERQLNIAQNSDLQGVQQENGDSPDSNFSVYDEDIYNDQSYSQKYNKDTRSCSNNILKDSSTISKNYNIGQWNGGSYSFYNKDQAKIFDKYLENTQNDIQREAIIAMALEYTPTPRIQIINQLHDGILGKIEELLQMDHKALNSRNLVDYLGLKEEI